MRLLRADNDGEVSLVGPFAREETPRYAILSHTWGSDRDEVSFTDFQSGIAKSMAGYKRIAFCQQRAVADGLNHFWIDTCCIDKRSSAELSEAINSMFRWYRESDRCYVYLEDVSISNRNDFMAIFCASRWMTRGWTLQELLAPFSVEFFSVEGELLGTKDSLGELISKATTISVAALTALTPMTFSRHERMRWVQRRTTKIEEDMVYCMLGLFEVSLPLIYGEGRQNALVRLDEAVSRRVAYTSARTLGKYSQ
ncbi:heterokaryon incompatibility [Microdochium trichocladiopsis]|uniref:Heterokaryon incompatibility n=1 Tax=Microdochium trichocladiopsis TaxID=1682393 RepID=A0A9P8YHB9_9PEZI|nr:heterokaryon incompatibility [Microdochium trichocladiopsis]KAH7040012.1 heterokaryon incompatibility [Microdochium trichocladiopsis]